MTCLGLLTALKSQGFTSSGGVDLSAEVTEKSQQIGCMRDVGGRLVAQHDRGATPLTLAGSPLLATENPAGATVWQTRQQSPRQVTPTVF